MNDKNKLIQEFKELSRELNGYSCAEVENLINDFVLLVDELTNKNENLTKSIKKIIDENEQLKAEKSKNEFIRSLNNKEN
ncbi:Uncharacterised protein [Mycoplasmopsis bovigenitalium]|uniref:Uncharacterized protein n=1 Tax=Mycoplasmopsis bovigenitalium TaxID=2112 RepID=A0A449A875_9BACT|nr:hypothetical protein [Mycoplasmopsis bovigenitalium]VEU60458.1 Uncharacterised protein [Mycoplasmopsis bovigenitalium]